MRIIILFLFFTGLGMHAQDTTKIRIAKPKGKCSATLLGKPGGPVSTMELATCNSVTVEGPCDYKVVSFKFSCTFKDRLYEYSRNDEFFSLTIREFILSLPPGDKFYIENIRVKSNITGQIFLLPNLKFKVIP